MCAPNAILSNSQSFHCWLAYLIFEHGQPITVLCRISSNAYPCQQGACMQLIWVRTGPLIPDSWLLPPPAHLSAKLTSHFAAGRRVIPNPSRGVRGQRLWPGRRAAVLQAAAKAHQHQGGYHEDLHRPLRDDRHGTESHQPRACAGWFRLAATSAAVIALFQLARAHRQRMRFQEETILT